MNLEEFRKGLESEARIENEELKEKIKSLEEKLESSTKEKDEEIDELKTYCKKLANRCCIYTKGDPMFCFNCCIPSDLCNYQFTEEEHGKAANYLSNRKNNRKNAYKTIQILLKLREERLEKNKREESD